MSRPRLQALRRAGGERVAELTTGAVPQAALIRAVATALPWRFDAAGALDLEATLELRLRDPHGGPAAPLALRIDHGRLSVTPGPAAGAGAAAELAAEDMIRLVAGSVGWPELISSGRMTLSGDPFLALRFPGLFRLPAGS